MKIKFKFKLLSLILMTCSLLISCGQINNFKNENRSKFPDLKGPYLGQKPPGDVPKIFAPSIVSSVYYEHSGAVFTPDGSELFWSRAINEGRSPRIIVIMHMKQENGVWTEPELASFNVDTYNHINSISPDGKRLYFFSENEREDTSSVWIVDKIENGWGKPRLPRVTVIDNPGSRINEVHETKSANLYCYGPTDAMPSGQGIIRSKIVDGKYQAYKSPGPTINFPHDARHPNHSPTIDPDEKFMIFVSSRPGGFGDQDLYISFHQPDETWGPAINLGPKINTVGVGNSWPQFSPDGKYLFFTSRVKVYNGDDIKDQKYTYADLTKIQESVPNGWRNIYWVTTSFIEKLKPEFLK